METGQREFDRELEALQAAIQRFARRRHETPIPIEEGKTEPGYVEPRRSLAALAFRGAIAAVIICFILLVP